MLVKAWSDGLWGPCGPFRTENNSLRNIKTFFFVSKLSVRAVH